MLTGMHGVWRVRVAKDYHASRVRYGVLPSAASRTCQCLKADEAASGRSAR